MLPNFGNQMIGLSSDRRMPARAELQHYLRRLEGYVEKLLEMPPSRAKAESLTDTVAQRLSALAETLKDRAARAGSDVSRYGDRAMESGRHSVALLAREVGVTPLAAVGAALGLGLIIGFAVRRRASAAKRPTLARRARRVRKGSRT